MFIYCTLTILSISFADIVGFEVSLLCTLPPLEQGSPKKTRWPIWRTENTSRYRK